MKLNVGIAGAGQRLDVWLSRRLSDLSRSRVQSLIKTGHVKVDGLRVPAHRKVTDAMQVEIDIPEPVSIELVPEAIPLDILYEDADLVVVNKPAGLVVHPAAGHWSGTLVNALLYHCKDLQGIGGETRPGLIHRLDMGTSGVIVVAKNERTMTRLARQFKNRKVHKEYVAIVRGIPEPPEGRIETLVGRSTHDRKKMSATPGTGRAAVTNYVMEEVFPEASLVRVTPETGRMHQIRVHMAHIGHPVVGDEKYGGRRERKGSGPCAARQMLHAELLAFKHPATNTTVEFKAPLPADMKALLKTLRKSKRRT